jgi:hypothetical protein
MKETRPVVPSLNRFQAEYMTDRRTKFVLLAGGREWDLLPAIEDLEATVGKLWFQ